MNPSRNIPMAKPNPPRLSERLSELCAIEHSGTYSNYGPECRRFERDVVEKLIGAGAAVAVANATLGLMLAIRRVMWHRPDPNRRYAIMPSFTFAATAHAALWAGLTPLLCDVEPDTWLPSRESEEALLERYRGQVAVMVPCTTFGNPIDLARYDDFYARYGVETVVDGAAALGSLDDDGKHFGHSTRWPIVYSLHATKPFSIGEGGLIHASDSAVIEELRQMSGFGFVTPRSASIPGLNAKLSEVSALTAHLQLERFHSVLAHRAELKAAYDHALPRYSKQMPSGKAQAHTYEFLLLPRQLAGQRARIMKDLAERGIGSGAYFSPHLAEQPYFAGTCIAGDLAVTADVASRVLTLPMFDEMTTEDVHLVSEHLKQVVAQTATEQLIPRATASHLALTNHALQGV